MRRGVTAKAVADAFTHLPRAASDRATSTLSPLGHDADAESAAMAEMAEAAADATVQLLDKLSTTLVAGGSASPSSDGGAATPVTALEPAAVVSAVASAAAACATETTRAGFSTGESPPEYPLKCPIADLPKVQARAAAITSQRTKSKEF
jgi:hypothetical protein